jgi:protein-L-isoaspartate(D-aspartate) O-methyltransferase
MSPNFAVRRDRMIRRQLVARGIGDERVLEAMAAVPRELFVPAACRNLAYADQAVPIGSGQTISQPYVVGAMLAALALRGDERVLEVGTGSGYTAALLSRLAHQVVSVERHARLVMRARAVLDRLGVTNAEVIHGDGSRGWPEQAPYRAIAVHALAGEEPDAFLEQLGTGGRLVIPLRVGRSGILTRFTRTESGVERTTLGRVAFVPLISDQPADG